MLVEMTFREGLRLREVLRTAFRSRTALAQVVFGLGENLSGIAGDDDYVVVVTNLIAWVEEHSRTPDLITSARTINPGDPQLREFERQYRDGHLQTGNFPSLPQPVLTSGRRESIVGALLRIPVTETYDGRSILLTGIPSSSLTRNSGIRRADIEGIINQLDELGRLNSGRRPLLIFIDNALGYAGDFAEVASVLRAVRIDLVQAYGGE